MEGLCEYCGKEIEPVNHEIISEPKEFWTKITCLKKKFKKKTY